MTGAEDGEQFSQRDTRRRIQDPHMQNLGAKNWGWSLEQKRESEGSRSIAKGQDWETVGKTGPGLVRSGLFIRLCSSRCCTDVSAATDNPGPSFLPSFPCLSSPSFSFSKKYKEPFLCMEYFETETANLGVEHISSRTRLLGLQSPLWA